MAPFNRKDTFRLIRTGFPDNMDCIHGHRVCYWEKLEPNPILNKKHILISIGVIIISIFFIVFYQLRIGNIGPKSEGLLCSDYFITAHQPLFGSIRPGCLLKPVLILFIAKLPSPVSSHVPAINVKK